MATLAHQTPETRALTEHDDDRRIAFLAEDRWIDYPRAREALQELERLLRCPERTRMPGLLIHGESNIGKSMIIQKFLRAQPAREFNADTGLLHRISSTSGAMEQGQDRWPEGAVQAQGHLGAQGSSSDGESDPRARAL